MMKKLFLTILCVTVVGLFLTGSASATLFSDDVNGFGIAHNVNGTLLLNDSTFNVGDTYSVLSRGTTLYTVALTDTEVKISFKTNSSFGTVDVGPQIYGIDLSLDFDVTSSADIAEDVSWDPSAGKLFFNFNGAAYTSTSYLTLALIAGEEGETGDTGEETLGTGDLNPDQPSMHNPIPAPILLLGTGLFGLAGFRRKFRK